MTSEASSRTFSPGIAGEKPGRQRLTALLLISLLFPIFFEVLGLRLSLTRLLIFAAFLPLLVTFARGKAFQVRAADFYMLAFSAWLALTLIYHHGGERVFLAGATVGEMLGGYLLGRTAVRNEKDFRQLIRWFIGVVSILLPIGLLENFFSLNIAHQIFGPVFDTFVKGSAAQPRWGLERAMTTFEHPILFGLFCSLAFSNAYYALRNKPRYAYLSLALIFVTTFTALSSAPLLSIVIQAGLMVWAGITSSRWRLLAGLIIFSYVTVDLLSNRTPITILINYITFDPNTAWTRINTWTYGSAEMWGHPVFGIGLNDWSRPSWLTPSIDNFWLLIGMRHGVVGVVLLMLAIGSGLYSIMKARNLSGRIADLRRGYVISLIGLYVTLCTVHVWGDTSVFVMFFVGAGFWFAEPSQNFGQSPSEENVGNTPSINRYTRQVKLHSRQ